MKAVLNNLKISPRKVREVVDMVRGMNAKEADKILQYNRRRSSEPVQKLIRSAIANAKDLYKKIDEDKLLVEEIYVNEGPSYRRYKARAYGRAARIIRRTSRVHVTLKVEDEKSLAKKEKAVQIKDVKREDVESKAKSGPKKTDKKKGKDTTKGKEGKFVKKMFQRKAV